MQAVILAAGKGTRLRPPTDDKPEVLGELGDKSLIEYAFDLLIDIGV